MAGIINQHFNKIVMICILVTFNIMICLALDIWAKHNMNAFIGSMIHALLKSKSAAASDHRTLMKERLFFYFYWWKSNQIFLLCNFHIKGVGEVAFRSMLFSCPCSRKKEIRSSGLEYPIWIQRVRLTHQYPATAGKMRTEWAFVKEYCLTVPRPHLMVFMSGFIIKITDYFLEIIDAWLEM